MSDNTQNMNLKKPIPTKTPGPEWAEEINESLDLIDAHDHSSGKGVKITPDGLNINKDLDMKGNSIVDAKGVQFVSHPAPLANPNDILTIYSANGNLYYNNESGVPVQITSGGSVTAAGDGISRAYDGEVSSVSLTINPASTRSIYLFDNIAPVTVTLPNASSVAPGRFYIFKKILGNDYTVTIQGTAGQTIDYEPNLLIDVFYGDVQVISVGDRWVSLYANRVRSEDIAPNTIKAIHLDSGAVNNDKIADGTITKDKLAGPGFVRSATYLNPYLTSASPNFSIPFTVPNTSGKPVVALLQGERFGADDNATVFVKLTTPSGIDYTQEVQFFRHSQIPASSVCIVDPASSVGSSSYTMTFTLGAGTYASLGMVYVVAYEL